MDDIIHAGTVLNVLSLEDSEQDYELIREQLINAGYDLNIFHVDKKSEFESALRNQKYDVILADFKLPGFDAFGALQLSNEICPEVPFICFSGSIGEETAIELLKQGAVDYVLKDRMERLPFAVKRALDGAREKEIRWLAEAALRESEQNYRTLANSGQALVWTSGTDKLYNYFNQVWLEFTGRSLQQELGNGWVEGVHPDDLQHCLSVYRSAFDKREKFSIEYRLRRYDGEYCWILNDGCPRYDSKGEFIGYIGHCLDITERKRAEEELTRSQNLLNETQRITKVGGWEYNLVTKRTTWTDETYRIHGVSRDYDPSHPEVDSNFYSPKDQKIMTDAFHRAIKIGEPYDLELQLINAQGEKLWVRTIGQIERRRNKIIRVYGNIINITESKLAELALKEQSERISLLNRVAQVTIESRTPEEMADNLLAIIREVMPCDAYYVDAFDETNILARGIRSYDTVDGIFSSVKVRDISIHPQDSIHSVIFFQRKPVRILRAEELQKKEYLTAFGDTLHRSASLLYAPMISRNRVVGSISAQSYTPNAYSEKDEMLLFEIARQTGPAFEAIQLYAITRQAEELIRHERDRAQGYLDTVETIIVVLDAEGKITTINRKGCQLFGRTEDDLVGQNWFSTCLPQPEGMEKAFPTFLMLIAGKSGAEYFENSVVTRSGDLRQIAWHNAMLHDDQGRTIGTLSSGEDITERKRQEEEKYKLEIQLQQAQKMESVGRLAGGVAHDFNNMLSVILGHAEMALDQVDPALPLYNDLTEIHKAAERSADLTRQLLAFARKQTIAPKVLDLKKTVEGMLKMLQRLIGEDIELLWLPKEDLWQIMIDPSQIDQILANLCVNARDAIADVGTITIKLENCTLDEDFCAFHAGFVPGEYVLLSLNDSGSGMDKETLGHIFEPFFTTKDLGKGTGLGLATVYGIIKQNNGFINVYSEPGIGTTFKIYLPRYIGKNDQVWIESVIDQPQQGHETILLVEDEMAILKLATRMLVNQGYTVLAASSPGEAIDLAREHVGEIHLLMTDVIMPEMNGRDLARNILSLYPHLKRLFMSGYTADVIAHHGMLDEGVYFIQKPFTTKDLSVKVREALDGG